MRDEQSTDPADLLLGALADEIADRLANRLAPHLVEIVEANGFQVISQERTLSRQPSGSVKEGAKGAVPDDGLWTARRVAAHYDVAVRFVYQHADELGCVRLGGGARPRLRFDPDVVRERWPRVGETPESASIARRSSPRTKGRRQRGRTSFELLDFDREP